MGVTMPRGLRVEFAGAVYHVMARGNERRDIFRDDRDRKRFLETLGEMAERFGVRVLAYCLMPNHYHLVLDTPRANLSQAMGWLQTTYTVRFNRRHRRVGHLFQGRFRAQLVDAGQYGAWLVQYVHYNPVRPRDRRAPIPPERKEALNRYEWSSHRDYAGWRQPAEWLSLEWLRFWGRSKQEAQRGYRQAMAAGFGKPVANPWEDLLGSLVLGTTELLNQARELIGRKSTQVDVRWTEREGAKETHERIRRLVATESDARLQIWARVRLGGERGGDVAKAFGYRDGSGVTQVVKRLEAAATRDPALRRRLEECKAAVSTVKG
jgi:putative transposase